MATEVHGKTIGTGVAKGWEAAEFWDRYDKGEFKK